MKKKTEKPWVEVDVADFFMGEAVLKTNKISYTLNKKHKHTFDFETEADRTKALKLFDKAEGSNGKGLIIY